MLFCSHRRSKHILLYFETSESISIWVSSFADLLRMKGFSIYLILGPPALWPWLESCMTCVNWDSLVKGWFLVYQLYDYGLSLFCWCLFFFFFIIIWVKLKIEIDSIMKKLDIRKRKKNDIIEIIKWHIGRIFSRYIHKIFMISLSCKDMSQIHFLAIYHNFFFSLVMFSAITHINARLIHKVFDL